MQRVGNLLVVGGRWVKVGEAEKFWFVIGYSARVGLSARHTYASVKKKGKESLGSANRSGYNPGIKGSVKAKAPKSRA